MPPSYKYGKLSLKSLSFVILGFSELSCNTKGFALFLLPKIIFLQISACLTLPSFRSLLKCPLPSQWELQYIWSEMVNQLQRTLSIFLTCFYFLHRTFYHSVIIYIYLFIACPILKVTWGQESLIIY